MCNFPQKAYLIFDHGSRRVEFNPSRLQNHPYTPIELPCGKCMACKLRYSSEVAIRAVHEAKCYSANCFITLTVDDDFIDEVFPFGSLKKEPFQLFAKRLRKRFQGVDLIEHPKTKEFVRPIRLLWCGEYGSKGNRPHFHACVFNFDFPDKELFQIKKGVHLYISKALQELWPFGFSTIGEVNYDSAAYLAGYVTKKLFLSPFSSPEIEQRYIDKYLSINENTGEFIEKMKEFIEFPRGFGLGRLYFEKFKEDFYDETHANSSVIMRRKDKLLKLRPPSYYDRIYEEINPEGMSVIKSARMYKASKKEKDTFERQLQKEEYLNLLINKKERSYEDDN